MRGHRVIAQRHAPERREAYRDLATRNCPALLQAPMATLRLAAAANSRPFVGGLD